jgi:large conductance mechanosensitive channel
MNLLAGIRLAYHPLVLKLFWRDAMGLLKEFKDFALRGNVIDMAVGVIIGGAFQKIVTSVTNDLILPPIGRAMSMTGKALNFKDQFYELQELPKDLPRSLDAVQKAGISVIAYGAFLQTMLDFLILAICVFIMVKFIQMARERFETKKAEAPAPAIPEDVKVLREIRDLLAKK